MTRTATRQHFMRRRAVSAGKFFLFMMLWFFGFRLFAQAALQEPFGPHFWRSLVGGRALVFAIVSALSSWYVGPILFPARRTTKVGP